MTISVTQEGATRTFCTILTTTSATAVFTAKDNTSPLVLLVNIANVTGSGATAKVELYDSSATTSYTILPTTTVAANTAELIKDVPLALDSGDEIRVTAGTSNALHVTITAMVRTGRLG